MTASQRQYLKIALAAAGAVVLVIVAAALVEYFGNAFTSNRFSSGEGGTGAVPFAPAVPDQPIGKMGLHDVPQPIPEVRFEDETGNPVALTDFKGKVVLLNIWATWCVPCRDEMPTLDRLQAELGGQGFEVVALSIDRAGAEAVGEFYAEVGVRHLSKYIDSSGKVAQALAVVGLPTTLLIDEQGREVGRLVGPAEWNTPEMLALIRRRLTEQSGSLVPGASKDAAAHDTGGAMADFSTRGLK